MGTRISNFTKSLSDYWEVYITFFIAMVSLAIVTLDFFGIDVFVSFFDTKGIDKTELLVSATLLAITTLTFSVLHDSNRLEKMKNLLETILHDRARLNADDFFEQANLDAYSEFKPEISKSKEVWLLGISNLKTVTNYETELKQALANKAAIRILMLTPDPDNPAILMQALRGLHPFGVETASAHGREAFGRLMKLCSHQNSTFNLQVRGLQFLPGFGLMVINPNQKQGVMRIKLYPYQRSKTEYPVFLLRANKDEHWYQFYKSQFEMLWESARIIDLIDTESK